jgi:isocitrate lyase
MRILILALLPTLLGGCVVSSLASTAIDVVTLPVKAVSAGVDAATTSQSEADEKRGRELRKADEQRAREERKRCKPFVDRRLPCPPLEAR